MYAEKQKCCETIFSKGKQLVPLQKVLIESKKPFNLPAPKQTLKYYTTVFHEVK